MLAYRLEILLLISSIGALCFAVLSSPSKNLVVYMLVHSWSRSRLLPRDGGQPRDFQKKYGVCASALIVPSSPVSERYPLL